MFNSVTDLQGALAQQNYISDHALATALFLALKLCRPLFLEGEAGVGKTEIAKVLAAVLDRDLIRLQCYEGLDVHTAVYEWDYARQILQVRLLEAAGHLQVETAQQSLFSPAFLLKRPLLQALEPSARGAPVLLIDELDRADEEFEAFLLEVLADFQVTVPELGTIRALEPPVVIITSNRTREIHDALKRRCFYHWIDYPDAEKELAIVQARLPHVAEALARQVVTIVQQLRQEQLYKSPGVAETLDWLTALGALDQDALSEPVAAATLGTLLKTREDIEHIQARLPALLPPPA
jgi:MoxR-like ATPase